MRIQPFPFILVGGSLAATALLMASIASAATWQVASYGDDPSGTATLRGALHVARDADTIDLTRLAELAERVERLHQLIAAVDTSVVNRH